MSEISVNSTDVNGKLINNSGKNTKYSALKKEYDDFMKKSSKSDFANSLTVKEKKLEYFEKLVAAAKQEGLEEEAEKMQCEADELKKIIETDKMNQNAAYPCSYERYNISFSGNSHTVNDVNSQKVTKVLEDSKMTPEDVSYVLQKCQDPQGHVDDRVLEAIKLLAASGFDANDMAPIIEYSTMTSEYSGDENFDEIYQKVLENSKNICDFKSMGLSNIDSIKYVAFLDAMQVEDVNSFKPIVNKMFKSKIGMDSSHAILAALMYPDKESGKNKVSPQAVDSVCMLKKVLSVTNKNEENELNNLINKTANMTFDTYDSVLVIDDEGTFTVYPKNTGKTVEETRQDYREMVFSREDMALIEFAARYCKDDGTIDDNSLRTVSALRNAGITYEYLFDLADFCCPNGNLGVKEINAVSELHSAGALSKDIEEILTAIPKDEEGNYDSEDFVNACALSFALVGAEELIELLPFMRNSSENKEYADYLLSSFVQNTNVTQTVNLFFNNGQIDKYAMNVVTFLIDNYLTDDTDETEFVETMKEMISDMKNPGDENVNEYGHEICRGLVKNQYSIDDIKTALELCKNKDGNFDSNLSSIVFNMSEEKFDMSDIISALNFCKDSYGNINEIASEKILGLLKEGESGSVKDYISN